MMTTYAISLSALDCTEDQRIALVDLVSDWLYAHYPLDSYAPGTTVRTREGVDDPLFRVTITESAPGSTHVETLTISVVLLYDHLSFDVRIVSTPTTSKVVPYSPPILPVPVAQLVTQALKLVPVEDANRFVTNTPTLASTELHGQEIAAFLLAPSRRLPVVVEILDFERKTPPLISMALGPLVGLVHMVQIQTKEALEGFLSIAGFHLINPGCIIINWAGSAEPEIVHRREIAPNSENYERNRLIRLIIDTAARSVAAPRVPPPPRREDDLFEPPTRETTSSEENDINDEQALHIEQLEATVDELMAAVADADRMLAEQRQQLEQKGGQLDELILRNVSLEMQAGRTPTVRAVASMTEALRLAREHCPFLVFHQRAIESGEGLEGPEPVSVLQDLVRLNEVARAWMSGEITGTSITLACRQMGLDFVPAISATARQKYEEDYRIDWRGGSVLAEAHLRRGKKSHLVRIHVYFDEETQQVVVAYIGRHLRDKRSA